MTEFKVGWEGRNTQGLAVQIVWELPYGFAVVAESDVYKVGKDGKSCPGKINRDLVSNYKAVWFNIHPENVESIPWMTRAEADRNAASGRIGCRKIELKRGYDD